MYKKHPIVNKSIARICKDIPDNSIGINGKIYDISNFKHPGGNTFIEINKGCDISALYETHHINISKADKYLSNLKIIGEYDPYFYYDFSLYKKLRKIVYNNFPTRKSRLMTIKEYLILLIFINISIITNLYLLQHTTFSFLYLLNCFVCSIFNTILGGYGHNGIHKLSYTSLFLDWNGLSTIEWLLEHVHSHHMYVNTEYDHDVQSIRPFLNWIPSKVNSLFASRGKHLIYLIAEIIVPFLGLMVNRFRWSLTKNNNIPYYIRYSPYIFIFRILLHIFFQGLYFGCITLILCLSIAGYYFSYLAHLNHGNKSNYKFDNEFVKHQIDNTFDILIDDKYRHIILNLNKQSMHHLFPTIDHCHLNKVYELIKPMLIYHDIFIYKDSLFNLNNYINKLLINNSQNDERGYSKISK